MIGDKNPAHFLHRYREDPEAHFGFRQPPHLSIPFITRCSLHIRKDHCDMRQKRHIFGLTFTGRIQVAIAKCRQPISIGVKKQHRHFGVLLQIWAAKYR